MGYKWQVGAWDHAVDSDHFYWLQIYDGPSMLKAIYHMWWARRNGWHRIKLELKNERTN